MLHSVVCCDTELEYVFRAVGFLSVLMMIRFTLFTLAKQGKQLGAYKLARYAYDKLQVNGQFCCIVQCVQLRE